MTGKQKTVASTAGSTPARALFDRRISMSLSKRANQARWRYARIALWLKIAAWVIRVILLLTILVYAAGRQLGWW